MAGFDQSKVEVVANVGDFKFDKDMLYRMQLVRYNGGEVKVSQSRIRVNDEGEERFTKLKGWITLSELGALQNGLAAAEKAMKKLQKDSQKQAA